jgi:hypothetical protein
MHPASLSIEELIAECVIKNTRGSGPGGQHRNKTDTAVVITHRSGVSGQASESRSQDTNKRNATHRLRLQLACHVRTLRTETSGVWLKRCVQQRGRVALENPDFPALLAEALDILFESQFQMSAAAERLNTTSSQILKLLKIYPIALQTCNRERAALGLHPLI